jgi:hypothetical protein
VVDESPSLVKEYNVLGGLWQFVARPVPEYLLLSSQLNHSILLVFFFLPCSDMIKKVTDVTLSSRSTAMSVSQ